MIIELNDKKWQVFEQFLNQKSSIGRPKKWTDRQIMEALLYVLHTGCGWRNLPEKYPPYITVYKRFRKWEKLEYFAQIRNACLEILIESSGDIDVAFIDATFVRGCLGGDKIGKTKCGKGSQIVAIVDSNSMPIAAIVASANPHEIKLIDEIIRDLPDIKNPKILVGDRAYDSDKHDDKLSKIDIKLIAPHRKNRTKAHTQNKEELNIFYKERWRVERLFAWMKSARRLLNRYDKISTVFGCFLDLFSILVIIKDL